MTPDSNVTSASPAGTAALSRDPHLTLRRVERQQQLIECLYNSRQPLTFDQLGRTLKVTSRTIARDVERLRHSGVPITVTPGRSGGASIGRGTEVGELHLDLPEVAALLASLAAVGPTVSDSAASAMRKLTDALQQGK